jgi:signal transduction histidine kinase
MQQGLTHGHSTPAAETQRITRDGQLVSVLRSSAPLWDGEGRPVGLVDTLTDISAHKQLDEESRALVRVRERELIAMDLHDGLSQSLYSVVLSLAAAERGAAPDSPAALRSVLREARHQVERVVEETRSYLGDLRVRELAPPDLAAALQLLVDSLRLNGGLQVSLELDPGVPPLLGAEVRRHVLYLVREAASNVVRHAQAKHAQISLQHDRATCSVVVSITDDGRGFELPAHRQSAGPSPGQHGLRTMAERAHLIGGQLRLSSQPGQGTAVRLEVPLASGLQDVQLPPAAASPELGARG